MTPEQLTTLAVTLGVTEDDARRMVAQEVARREAGERYRKSDAYKRRLLQQKLVRKALKEVQLDA